MTNALAPDPQRLQRARVFLEQAIADGHIPGAVALIAQHGDVVAHWALGSAQVEPERRAMQLDTIFDLASLTKAVAGATATLLLLEEGAWSLDEPVARFIPEFGRAGKREVTIRQLLSHSAGFAGWLPTYAWAREPEEALRVICDLELGYGPGTDTVYSDIGFSVIGHLVRRVAGQTIDQLLHERVWAKLGLKDTMYNPPPGLRGRIAATERGNRYEQAMVRALGLNFDAWRPDEITVGQVNDGNTYYPLGGVSSHAGLFSTASDLLAFALAYIRGQILSPATVAEATSDQTAGLPRGRGLGWELLRKGAMPREEWLPSAAARRVHPRARNAVPTPRPYGELLSGPTYGHTGFTGTSLAIDPEHDLIVILLTNRTHPDANNFSISWLRPRFHNLVAASLIGGAGG